MKEPSGKAQPAEWGRILAKRMALPAGVIDRSYTYRVYATAKFADSEGDLYEMITGHRSAVIDAAEAKRAK